MTPATEQFGAATSTSPGLLWLTIIVVGAVFFASTHSLSLSGAADWSPSEDWAEDVEGGLGQTVKMVSLSVLALLGAYLLVRRSDRTPYSGHMLAVLLLAYVASCAISIAWSVDATLTTRRAALLVVCCLAAIGVSKHFSMRDITMMALLTTTAYLAIGVCAEVASGTFRPWVADYRFAGTLHPNAQGVNCAVMCLAGAAMARVSPRVTKLCLTAVAIGLVFVLLTKSRMSLASLLVAGGLAVAMKWSTRVKVAFFLTGVAVICGMLLVGQFARFGAWDGLTQCVSLGRQEQMESLTGRLPLWNEISHYIDERPFFGYGYRAFWNREHTLAIAAATSGWQAPHAHSAYLDTALDIGIPAATLFAITVLFVAYRAATACRQTGDPACRFAYALLVFAICDSLLESNFIIPTFAPFVAGCAALHIAMHADESSNSSETEVGVDVPPPPSSTFRTTPL
jgi:exopolysaccharide production protein ExoQ